MELDTKDDKFTQIRGIYSQFSEESKEKLLERAKELLEVQKSSCDEGTGRCPDKK
jgi:coenzyme F420-reducing hydrogenase alpha subunit